MSFFFFYVVSLKATCFIDYMSKVKALYVYIYVYNIFDCRVVICFPINFERSISFELI